MSILKHVTSYWYIFVCLCQLKAYSYYRCQKLIWYVSLLVGV